MSKKYFDNFGRITVNGQEVVNILARPKILEKVSSNPYAFHPYTLREGERPDIIADKYYKSMEFSWLVYLSNQVVDPYYGWFLNTDQFERMLKTKYGSSIIANRKVLGYRVNWDEDISSIEPATYNALPDQNKRYWDPVYNANGSILSYERSKHDWTVATNYYQLINTTANGFSVGDLITTKLNDVTMAMAEVYASNSTSIVIQHIEGTATRLVQYVVGTPGNLTAGESAYISNSTVNTIGTVYSSTNSTVIIAINNTIPNDIVTIIGDTSNATVITTTSTPIEPELINDTTGYTYSFNYTETITTCIPSDELVYWCPWTAYEYEDESNSDKKHIRLLDSALSTQAMLDLKRIMK
jgi:hypothetical protein